jgi:hypothetical protein
VLVIQRRFQFLDPSRQLIHSRQQGIDCDLLPLDNLQQRTDHPLRLRRLTCNRFFRDGDIHGPSNIANFETIG